MQEDLAQEEREGGEEKEEVDSLAPLGQDVEHAVSWPVVLRRVWPVRAQCALTLSPALLSSAVV